MSAAAKKSGAAQVQLVAWDADSPTHVERMKQQRIACTWGVEMVEGWRELQRSGDKTFQWIVLSDADTDKQTKLKAHLEKYPAQSDELVDSAASLGGKPHASSGTSFIPVGHISLDNQGRPKYFDERDEGMYFIGNFYVSGAIQNCGLGRAAMDMVEKTATSPPLNAKSLALDAVGHETNDPEDPRWAALGRAPPQISNQLWYERRGYQIIKRVEKMYETHDSTGKSWWFSSVFMKKDIR